MFKQKINQQTKSAQPVQTNWSFSRQSSESLETKTKSPDADHNSKVSTGFGHNFSRIPIFSPNTIRIQPKLIINTPGDKYEQEADKVAEQVMANQMNIDIQAKTDVDAAEASATQEKYWTGSIKGHLGENPVKHHTLNNFSDTPLRYLLRIKNKGYCLLSLETQYEYKTTGLQRAWIALFEQRGKTGEVINGLPPHSSLHLRLFGERDYTDRDQTWCDGTVETELQK